MEISSILWQKSKKPTVVFFLSLLLAFPIYSRESNAINTQKKTLVQSTKNQVTGNPRLIVLPLQQEEGQVYNRAGLAIHFLLGNVVALHTDLKEFWFGWRVKKIFLKKERFWAYCHNKGLQLDFSKLGKEQGIRYWLGGNVQQQGRRMKAALLLTDTMENNKEYSTTLTLDISNQLIDFRKGFLAWMEKCGLPFPDTQKKMVLWPEKSNPKGLDHLGRALETYYLHSSWGKKGPLDLYWFDSAVSAAPSSYLAHDLKGWALYKNKDYEAAKESFRSALSINPHGSAVLAGLMWCAIYTQDNKAAYTWAMAKADLRGESREKEKAKVKKRIKKAARKRKE